MKMNDNIMKTTYVFIGLFALLIVYLLGYVLLKSDEDINNPYNKRQNLFAEKVIRGTIYSSDMTALALTETDEEGNEKRVYPYNDLFCHVVGSFDMGRYCLESAYNFELLTTDKSIIEEVKAELNNEKLQGNSIVTTLDINLQSACYKALGDYSGSVIVMDPKTGDILSMVSKPGYNPNDIKRIWEDIKNDDSGILLNRATQGLYPPGSVFKIFSLGEYIESHKASYMKYSYECEGTIKFTDFSMSCSNKRAHGKIDLLSAFANSCNCAFVNIGNMIDADKMNEYCRDRLFGTELPIDIPYKSSIIKLSDSDSEFMKSQTVIGQGETLVTPIHMCMVMSSIANDGILMNPRFVKEIIDEKGKNVKEFAPKEYKELYTKDDTAILREYLREVVKSGTATRLNKSSMDVYGKTGTAQINTNGKADSWFVGAAKANDGRTYVMAVVLENIDENTSPSIVVTKEIINYLDK